MFLILAATVLSWGGKTHVSIVKHSLKALSNDKRKSGTWYNTKMKKYIPKLLTGSTDPDQKETGAGTHYYVYPGEGTVNQGQYYKAAKRCTKNTSARIRLERHYENAIKLYKQKKYSDSFHILGRAIHYLGDIGCPPHAAGIQYPTSSKAINHHKLFEAYVNDHVSSSGYHITSAKGYYGILNKSKWAVQINKVCHSSASYKSHVVSLNTAKYSSAGISTVKLSERYTCELLDRFYRDTHKAA